MLNSVRGLIERKCGYCGKKFCRVNWTDYAYKAGVKYFCSYKCMRAKSKCMPKTKNKETNL